MVLTVISHFIIPPTTFGQWNAEPRKEKSSPFKYWKDARARPPSRLYFVAWDKEYRLKRVTTEISVILLNTESLCSSAKGYFIRDFVKWPNWRFSESAKIRLANKNTFSKIYFCIFSKNSCIAREQNPDSKRSHLKVWLLLRRRVKVFSLIDFLSRLVKLLL